MNPALAAVAPALEQIANGHGPANRDPLTPAAEELATLLDLPSVGLELRGAVIHGRGGKASADLKLSDGSTVTFESLRDFANPTRLALEMTACTGAMPRLKAPQAQLALKLLRQVASHEATLTLDEISTDMGMSYLQAAPVLEIDMTDQGERWGAFSHLESLGDPYVRSRVESTPYATGTAVLRHHDGTLYVRCGWFYGYARVLDLGVSQAELAHRMSRVGWDRRGGRGAIKATAPSRDASLVWNFYSVPDGWKDGRP
jgi:hypothetical protein